MKNIYRILISSVICILIAAGCYFWATAMIGSNFSFRSPLKESPPTPGAQLGQPSTNRVVIVLIDALRYDTSLRKDTMPTLARLREQGASARMYSQAPSYSEPGYSTILTGAWPWVNDGPVFNLEYPDIPAFTQDNLFSSAHRAGYKTAISGYYWFEKLVPQTDVDLSFYTEGEDETADNNVVTAALPWLTENKAQLVLIHLDQVDYAGHHLGGPKSIAWHTAASQSDELLAQIVATLDLSKDTLLVISDHGQIDAGGHGGQDAVTLEEPFVLVGAGVVPGEYADVALVDVAPTLSALLGLNLPASTQGQVHTEMLALEASVAAALPEAVQTQQTTLLTAYASAIDQELKPGTIPTGSNVDAYQKVMSQLRVNKEFGERLPRALIAAVFLTLVIFWLGKNIRKGAVAWIIGGIIFAFLFNYRYAVWDAKTYSLSSVVGESELIIYVAVTSVLALLITWLLILLEQRYFKLLPAEAARKAFGLVFTVAFINGLPAILSFVLNGLTLTWTLPNYFTEFLATLSLIEVLAISGSGLVFAGLTALIAWLAARKPSKKAEKKK